MPVHLIFSYYLYLFSGSYFPCTYCPVHAPTEQVACTLKAVPVWEQTVSETTKGCMSVSEGSRSRPALPSFPSPPPPSKSLLPLHPPLHAHPYFAHYMQTLPKPSQHSLQNACLSTFNPPNHHPQRKSDYSSNTVRLHLYLWLSVSAISVSTHTGTQKLTSFFSFF